MPLSPVDTGQTGRSAPPSPVINIISSLLNRHSPTQPSVYHIGTPPPKINDGVYHFLPNGQPVNPPHNVYPIQHLPAPPQSAHNLTFADFLNTLISGPQAQPNDAYNSSMAQQGQISQNAIQEAAQARMAAQQQAAQQKYYQGVENASYSGPNSYGPPASGGAAASHPILQHWIDHALNIVGMGKRFEPGLFNMIEHESGGNPRAINLTDSNAAAGHPSQGLMQTIPGTFAEYTLNRPGHQESITNPVDNIIAGLRYALANYGKHMVLAGGRHDAAGNYIGY